MQCRKSNPFWSRRKLAPTPRPPAVVPPRPVSPVRTPRLSRPSSAPSGPPSPLSRSTVGSSLGDRCVRPPFIFVIRASGSCGCLQSWLDPFLGRFRSRVGSSTPAAGTTGASFWGAVGRKTRRSIRHGRRRASAWAWKCRRRCPRGFALEESLMTPALR